MNESTSDINRNPASDPLLEPEQAAASRSDDSRPVTESQGDEVSAPEPEVLEEVVVTLPATGSEAEVEIALPQTLGEVAGVVTERAVLELAAKVIKKNQPFLAPYIADMAPVLARLGRAEAATLASRLEGESDAEAADLLFRSMDLLETLDLEDRLHERLSKYTIVRRQARQANQRMAARALTALLAAA